VELRIGAFRDVVEASFSYWGRTQYQHQWKVGLHRTVMGSERSCLITCLANPTIWWILYRFNNKVFFQNQLHLFDVEEPIENWDPYAAIPARATISEEGDIISEWETDVVSIERLYTNLTLQNH
jgi:hypothetical protein